MFGLTEQEISLYKDLTQDFAVRDVSPMILSKAGFITPILEDEEGEEVPDTEYANQLLADIETIITLTATHMSYDYAFLQAESDKSEEEIINDLHDKYDASLVTQFIKYSITFTTDVINRILGEIILELPYLYMSVIEDESFDEDAFLEEKMKAYDKYLNDNFTAWDEKDDDSW